MQVTVSHPVSECHVLELDNSADSGVNVMSVPGEGQISEDGTGAPTAPV
jgi:hypothetical protein